MEDESSTNIQKNQISNENAALYDRQIRLWGSSAQRSIQNLKVLLIGATGIGIEVAKNLILSGIKSLTIVDDCKITEEDVASQYTLTLSDIGKNRAKANLKPLKILNKNVEVTYEDDNIAEKPMKYFKQFNAVVMTVPLVTKIVFVDEICRDSEIKFFYAGVFGEFGFSVCGVKCLNLLNANRFNIITKLDKLNIERSKNNCYALFKVLHEFVKQYDRKPVDTCEDRILLTKCRNETLKNLVISDEYVTSEYTDVACDGEFGPTCTIVGGFLAQDIIKSSYCEIETGVKFFDPLQTICFCLQPNLFTNV